MSRVQLLIFVVVAIAVTIIILPYVSPDSVKVTPAAAAAAAVQAPAPKKLAPPKLVFSKVWAVGGQDLEDTKFKFLYTVKNEGEETAYRINVTFSPWVNGFDLSIAGSDVPIPPTHPASRHQCFDTIPKLEPGQTLNRELEVKAHPSVAPRPYGTPISATFSTTP